VFWDAFVYYRVMGNASAGDVSAFILAGGKSTRMGTDKAFLQFEGRTLLARALDLARSITPNVSIVGNREKFSAFGQVVDDIFRECGPLAGIHAALRHSTTEINLVLAVDMPFISVAFLHYLLRQARSAPGVAVVVPRASGRRQPLCAMYRREFAAFAEPALRAGQNRIDRLFEEIPTRTIDESELDRAGFSPEIFRNLNTPDEVESAKSQSAQAEMHR
jgi:molybdenum cofactor guanylyltransferase